LTDSKPIFLDQEDIQNLTEIAIKKFLKELKMEDLQKLKEKLKKLLLNHMELKIQILGDLKHKKSVCAEDLQKLTLLDQEISTTYDMIQELL